MGESYFDRSHRPAQAAADRDAPFDDEATGAERKAGERNKLSPREITWPSSFKDDMAEEGRDDEDEEEEESRLAIASSIELKAYGDEFELSEDAGATSEESFARLVNRVKPH